MFSLIDYSEYLGEAAGQTLLDFTALRLVVTWVSEVLERSSFDLENIRTVVKTLASTISITSGHGMMEIWSAFLPSDITVDNLQTISKLTSSCYRLKIDGTDEGAPSILVVS